MNTESKKAEWKVRTRKGAQLGEIFRGTKEDAIKFYDKASDEQEHGTIMLLDETDTVMRQVARPVVRPWLDKDLEMHVPPNPKRFVPVTLGQKIIVRTAQAMTDAGLGLMRKASGRKPRTAAALRYVALTLIRNATRVRTRLPT